ncbi:MAG TPA: glycosyltransferase [Puia sp.]|nr:glycosyltransferase [Puia sp.]
MHTDIEKNRRTKVESSAIFSILIPTWNNLDCLKLCIESIRKNSSLPHQLIVHVNQGNDGTLSWIKLQANIDFTYSEQNVGVCYALNAAATLATTDFIVYMNDDMYACPAWDAKLYDEIKNARDNYFFFSATAIEPVASSNCAIEKDFGRGPADFRESELLQQFEGLPMGDWLGSTWPPNVVHRNLWELVGGYSVEFSPGMYSDPDFSMKLWMAGVRLFKGVSASRVYHFGSHSTRRVSKNRGYYTFIAKWKMTSSTLTKLYLRRGQAFDGELSEPIIDPMTKLKNFFRQLTLPWHSY